MSDAFERFLAGQGSLANLLREVPQFEPPASMQSAFVAQARAAQREHDAKGMAFEPPASLQSNVMAEAARLHAAQQPRRDALLAAMDAGTPADEALGARVSEATNQWLADYGDRQAAKRDHKTLTPRRRFAWWPQAGVVLGAAIIGGVATLWLQQEEPAQQWQMVAVPAPPTAEAQQPTAPPAQAAPLAKPARPRSAAPPREERATVAQLARQRQAARSEQADPPPAANKEQQVAATEQAPAADTAGDRAVAMHSESEAAARALNPLTEATPASRDTNGQVALAAKAQVAQPAPVAPTAAAPAAATAGIERAHAPPATTEVFTIGLEDDLHSLLTRAQNSPARNLQIFVADPDSTAVRTWLVRIRALSLRQTIVGPERAADVPAGTARLHLSP